MRIYTWIRERTLFFKIINYERLKDSFISYVKIIYFVKQMKNDEITKLNY